MDNVEGNGWPAVEYEPRPWDRSEGQAASRRQLRRAAGPYPAAVPPFIAQIDVSLNPEVLAAADEASHALARFDAEAAALIAPFPAILLRTESASSSEVENLTAGARQVALAEIGAARSENARLIVANTRAMDAAIALSADLNEDAVIAMQSALLQDTAPRFTGGWRDEQVWIGGGAISPHDAEFIPPHHERLPALMRDLMDFVDRTDVPVLAQAAIAHAQFETIHPFPDGNGRTGRALIHAMLHRGGLTQNLTVPVSAGLLRDPRAYFQALMDYRSGDVNAIVHSITEASFSAISNGRRLAADLVDIRERWGTSVTARSGSSARRLIELLPAKPVITTGAIAAALGVSTVAAGTAVNQLVAAGVLTQVGAGSRNRIWQSPEILDALDAFAARARRGRT